jgi:glutamine synthetase
MTRTYDAPPGLGFPTEDRPPVLPACTLVRLIGKPALDWTLDDLMDLVPAFGIRLVSLMHIGGDGWPKTLDFVPRDLKHLHEIFVAGERADGSSLFGDLGIAVGSSDIVLRPRISTGFLDPFADEPTLVLLAAHYGRDGAVLPQSPTTLVQAAYQRLKKETGVDLHALGEVEFFLGKRPEETDVYGAGDRGYHASSPFVFGERMRREALRMLAEIGVPVKYGHSEVGHIQPDEVDARVWEQHEIELALQPLPAAADSVILTQWVLRNLARRHGMRCTFEPILRKGHAGSGMHFHLSPVVDGIHGRHTTAEGTLTDEAKWLIAGLVRLAGASMAFGNRSLNSFLRLSQAKEAPNNVTWGQFNRKALVRLPIVATDERGRAVVPETIEFRLPDGSAHPHLVLAVVAQAMLAGRDAGDLDGIIERTRAKPGETGACPPNGFSVPKSFQEVAAALGAERVALEAGGVFPAAMIDRMIETLKTRKE